MQDMRSHMATLYHCCQLFVWRIIFQKHFNYPLIHFILFFSNLTSQQGFILLVIPHLKRLFLDVVAFQICHWVGWGRLDRQTPWAGPYIFHIYVRHVTSTSSRPPAEKISSKIHSLSSTVPKGAYHIGKPCDVEKSDVVVCKRYLNWDVLTDNQTAFFFTELC